MINNYFNAKAERGTDVKPDSVTALLKDPYKKFTETAKIAHPDGTQPFAGPAEQMLIVDKSVEEIIRGLEPSRVKKASIKVVMGKVQFEYEGSDKAKTKGWFAGSRGREAVK